MNKVAVVTLREDRDRTLERLRELEIMHVRYGDMESPELAASIRACEELQSVIVSMADFATDASSGPGDYGALDSAQLAITVQELLRELGACREKREKLLRQVDEAAPWGDFDPSQLEYLRRRGVYVYLCAAPERQLPELPENAVLEVISGAPDMLFFTVVSDEELSIELPVVRLPSDSLGHLRQQVSKCDEHVEHLEHELRLIAPLMPRLEQALQASQDIVDFLRTRDSMGEEDRLLYVEGYVPAKRSGELQQAAKEAGWAVLLEEPDEDDRRVPTMLTVPKWLSISKPIFQFVGIQPGYREFDISAWFLIFFAIFFAMIFGDAGYGSLFLVATLIGKAKLGKRYAVQLNLVMVLSVATIVWGALSGTWFGIEQKYLPPFMQGVPWCREMVNVQYLCFLIGALHLSIAHGWKALVVINSLRCLSQFGWIAIIWGNFFLGSYLVTGREFPPLAKWLYIVGLVMVLLFTEPSRRIFKTFGSGVGSIVGNGINSFVDVLSYIRLFAVGLSSYYVAMSFNGMGLMLKGSFLTMLVGIVVILFGHVLNIALCALGVLVHGIRLNTLEFSGHIGIGWAGIPFRAFARRYREASGLDAPGG